MEKLGGVATIIVGVAALCLISVFEPPVFVQIICAFVGSIICLIGIVFCFAEGTILTKEHRGNVASKAA